jgi:hypothetical protein
VSVNGTSGAGGFVVVFILFFVTPVAGGGSERVRQTERRGIEMGASERLRCPYVT